MWTEPELIRQWWAGGRTTLTLLVAHQSKENRDMHVNSGMEGGLQESLDLAEQVARGLR